MASLFYGNGSGNIYRGEPTGSITVGAGGGTDPGGPGTEEPGPGGPGTEEPGPGGPGTEEPGPGGPGTEEPGPGGPGTEEPGPGGPGTENPGPEEPGTEEPGTDEPDPGTDPGVNDNSNNGFPDTGDGGGGDGPADGADGEGGTDDVVADAVVAADDMMYIYRRDEEMDGDADRAGDAPGEETDEVTAELVDLQEKAAESFFAAAALELLRDLESMVGTVRGDRELLERALASLQEEYLQRDAAEWTPLRPFLRDLFDQGNRQLQAITRVLGEMHRQMGDFRGQPVEKLDGMLMESLQELLDSASRHSGETGALARSIEALAAALRNSRRAGQAIPDEAALAELVRQRHQEVMLAWLEANTRRDPMGKELNASRD